MACIEGDHKLDLVIALCMATFFQRARLILAAKGVKYNCINIDLNNKPEWFFDLTPYGEVPVVIHNSHNVYESLICAGETGENVFRRF